MVKNGNKVETHLWGRDESMMAQPHPQASRTRGKMREIYTSWSEWISTVQVGNRCVSSLVCFGVPLWMIVLCDWVWREVSDSRWENLGVFLVLVLLSDTDTWNVCINFHQSYSLYRKEEKPLSFSFPLLCHDTMSKVARVSIRQGSFPTHRLLFSVFPGVLLLVPFAPSFLCSALPKSCALDVLRTDLQKKYFRK